MAKLKAIPLSEYKKRLKAIPVSEFEKKSEPERKRETSNLIDEDIEDTMRSQWMKRPVEEDIKELKAGARGIGQAAFGTGDELEAGVRTAKDLLTGDLKGKSLLDRYYATKKDINKEIKEGQEKYPLTAYGAELAGSAAGGALGKLAGLRGLGAGAAGALTGLGMSDAEIARGELGRAAVDTATGAALGKLSERLLGAIGRVGLGRTKAERESNSGLSELAGRLLGDIDERTVNRYLKNPEKFEESIKRTSTDIAKEMWDELPEALHNYLKKESGEAYKILDKATRDFKPKEVVKAYDKIKNKIVQRSGGQIVPGSIEDETLKYIAKSKNMWESVRKIDRGGRNVPLPEGAKLRIKPRKLKDRIIKLDIDDVFAKKNTEMADLLQRARKSERTNLDQILKKNPEYRQHMKENVQPLGRLQGFMETDLNTFPKLQTFLKRMSLHPEKLTTEQKGLMDELQKRVGGGKKATDDYMNALLYEALDGPSTKSSRDVNKWAVGLGGLVASAMGMVGADSKIATSMAAGLGGTVGHYLSQHGKKAAFEAIKKADKFNKTLYNMSPIARSKALKDLENEALRKGGEYMLTLELVKKAQSSIHGERE